MSSTRTKKDARAKSEDVRGSAVPISFYLRQQEKQILEQLSRKKYHSAVLTFEKRNKTSRVGVQRDATRSGVGTVIQLDVRCPPGFYDTYSVHTKIHFLKTWIISILKSALGAGNLGCSLLSRYWNEHGVEGCHIIS
jgi:hypothetical protein